MSNYDLSQQEIFEKVAKHLFKQAKRAVDPDGAGCAYRANDGSMCAIGFLIADEDYNGEMEGYGISRLIGKSFVPPALNTFLQTHRPVLRELQYIHDNMNLGHRTPEKYVRDGLVSVADKFSLDAGFLKDLKWGE